MKFVGFADWPRRPRYAWIRWIAGRTSHRSFVRYIDQHDDRRQMIYEMTHIRDETCGIVFSSALMVR